MGTRPRSLLFGLCAVFAVAIQLCNAERSVAVVGNTECLDCAEKNIKTENAVKGLRVAINCKVSNEQYETQATAELGSSGDFAVKLPAELLTDAGELKHECFAQLHAKSNQPCPGKNGLVPAKLVLRSKDAASGEHTFAPTSGGKLSFSSATCASATFWPCPPLAWKKKFPHMKPHDHPHPHMYKFHSPPKYMPAPPHGGGYYKPPEHEYKPPTAPSGGYYKPPAPEYKPPAHEYKPPAAPSGGYYKPPAPEYKPPAAPSGGYYKPPAPEYKPPAAPSGGYYKPPTPAHKQPSGGGYYKPPAQPTYKPSPVPYHEHDHPMYKKPMPPFHEHDHPMFKKPMPPFHEHDHPMYKKPMPPFHEHHFPMYKKPMPPFHHHEHPGHPHVEEGQN